jgi:hypothetical protein
VDFQSGSLKNLGNRGRRMGAEGADPRAGRCRGWIGFVREGEGLLRMREQGNDCGARMARTLLTG